MQISRKILVGFLVFYTGTSQANNNCQDAGTRIAAQVLGAAAAQLRQLLGDSSDLSFPTWSQAIVPTKGGRGPTIVFVDVGARVKQPEVARAANEVNNSLSFLLNLKLGRGPSEGERETLKRNMREVLNSIDTEAADVNRTGTAPALADGGVIRPSHAGLRSLRNFFRGLTALGPLALIAVGLSSAMTGGPNHVEATQAIEGLSMLAIFYTGIMGYFWNLTASAMIDQEPQTFTNLRQIDDFTASEYIIRRMVTEYADGALQTKDYTGFENDTFYIHNRASAVREGVQIVGAWIESDFKNEKGQALFRGAMDQSEAYLRRRFQDSDTTRVQRTTVNPFKSNQNLVFLPTQIIEDIMTANNLSRDQAMQIFVGDLSKGNDNLKIAVGPTPQALQRGLNISTIVDSILEQPDLHYAQNHRLAVDQYFAEKGYRIEPYNPSNDAGIFAAHMAVLFSAPTDFGLWVLAGLRDKVGVSTMNVLRGTVENEVVGWSYMDRVGNYKVFLIPHTRLSNNQTAIYQGIGQKIQNPGAPVESLPAANVK